jgi:hypothetical protein
MDWFIEEPAMKRILTSIIVGALALSPIAAEAQRGGGHAGSFHGGGGGAWHGGGGGAWHGGSGGAWHGGSGGAWHGGAWHGGYYGHGGYWYGGGWGWGCCGWWGWPSFYFGFYYSPWYWDYPVYPAYYPAYPAYPGYPSAPYYSAPPYGADPQSGTGAVPPPDQAAPPACGHWQWSDTDRRYYWVTDGCH